MPVGKAVRVDSIMDWPVAEASRMQARVVAPVAALRWADKADSSIMARRAVEANKAAAVPRKASRADNTMDWGVARASRARVKVVRVANIHRIFRPTKSRHT